MSDIYHRPFHPALPYKGYPYYGHFQYPPPYSQRSFPPPLFAKQPPPHVLYPPVPLTNPPSLRRRLSRPNSLRVKRQISNLHSRVTLKKRRRTTTQSPVFPVSGALGATQLAKGRPYNWRSGYKPPSKSYFRTHFESFTAPYAFPSTRSWISKPPLRLNFLLVATQALPNIFYDLRQPEIDDTIYLPYSNRLPNTIDFYQLITSPPIHHMTLWHRKLPWQINIEASQPNGITMYDFFRQIYGQLHQPVAQEEYYTDELAPSDREMLIIAFQTRCAMFPEQLRSGVRRIDFLGQEVCFIGLGRRRGRRWEFKTQSPLPKERMIID